jgi:DNA-binding CsgD family transcriptional regulator
MTTNHRNRGMNILDLWKQGLTAEQIAEACDIHRDTVFKHIRLARHRGDARAARRPHQKPAQMRRLKIFLLASLNLPKRKIASIVGVSYDTVKLRMREMQD